MPIEPKIDKLEKERRRKKLEEKSTNREGWGCKCRALLERRNAT